jgi:hypothetical protein
MFIGVVNSGTDLNYSSYAWFFGDTVPPVTLGNNNDYYVYRDTLQIYKRINDSWSIIDSVKSHFGGNDAIWNFGADDPIDALFNDGEYYFNTSYFSVFLKEGGEWDLVGNIRYLYGSVALSEIYPGYTDHNPGDIGYDDMTDNEKEFSVIINQMVSKCLGEQNNGTFHTSIINEMTFYSCIIDGNEFLMVDKPSYLMKIS